MSYIPLFIMSPFTPIPTGTTGDSIHDHADSKLLIILLSAAPVRGRHSGFAATFLFYCLHPPPSLQPLPCSQTLSHHIHKPHLDLLRFILPDSSIFSIFLPIYQSSFLRTCPNHLSRASCVFFPNRSACAVPLIGL